MIIDFSKYSAIKIGPKLEVLELNEKLDFKGFLIGGANNLLISNAPKKELGILGKKFDFLEILEENEKECILKIGCATSSKKIYLFAKEKNLKGFEFLLKIPGTLGGLLKMNAGLKDEEISKNLFFLSLFDKELLKDEAGFAYRKSAFKGVAFEAVFRLEKGFDNTKDSTLKAARSNQPSGASFGSIFKNPPGNFAGYLIEAVGLKGFSKGRAMISDKHANFLINKGGASFDDALFLINLAKERVLKEFNILLEEEVIII